MTRTVGHVYGFTLIEVADRPDGGRDVAGCGAAQLSVIATGAMVRAATQALYTDVMLLKSEAVKRNRDAQSPPF